MKKLSTHDCDYLLELVKTHGIHNVTKALADQAERRSHQISDGDTLKGDPDLQDEAVEAFDRYAANLRDTAYHMYDNFG
jgi:hypothetical protein